MSGTASNRGASDAAGLMATARRGGIDRVDIWRARESIGPRATASMIARHLGCCLEDVQRLLAPAPIATPGVAADQEAAQKLSEAERRDEAFRTKWRDGVTVPELALYFGISVTSVARWRERLGLKPRAVGAPSPWTPHLIAKVIATGHCPEKLRELATETGLTYRAVMRRSWEIRTADKAKAA